MPVKGITQKTPTFSRIADIRKGMPKLPKRPGPDLKEKMRLTFLPGEEENRDRFAELFPSEVLKYQGETHLLVTRLRFIFPFNQLSRVWDTNIEAHRAGYMVGQSDGQFWNFLRDERDDVIVHNGIVIKDHQDYIGNEYRKGEQRPYDRYEPLGTLPNGDPVLGWFNSHMDIMVCDERGIPPFGLRYFRLHTTSWNDAHRVSGQLAGIFTLANDLGKSVAGLPLILFRVPIKISKPINGKRVRATDFLLEVMPDPLWIENHFKQLNQEAYAHLLKSPEEIIEDAEQLVDKEDFLLDTEPDIEGEFSQIEDDYQEDYQGEEIQDQDYPEVPEIINLLPFSEGIVLKTPADIYRAISFDILKISPKTSREIIEQCQGDYSVALNALCSRYENELEEKVNGR